MHPQISQVAGKRAALLATFGSMTASSESCSHQFSSMSSIGRVPPDSSGDACKKNWNHFYCQRDVYPNRASGTSRNSVRLESKNAFLDTLAEGS